MVAYLDKQIGMMLQTLLCALCILYGSSRAAAELVVYPPVPGLSGSGHYKVRVRPAGGEWKRAFAWETACTAVKKKTDACFEHLAGWTHSRARPLLISHQLAID